MNKNYARNLLVLGLLSLVLASQVRAQIAGGMTESTEARTDLNGRANSYISGTVFDPSGRPVRVRTTVRLSSMLRGDITGSTDDSGKFIFSRVGAGNYTIVVDSDKDYEAVSQQVSVIDSNSTIAQTYTVSIRLTEKNKAAGSKPGVVRPLTVDPTKKAIDFYKQALESIKDGDKKAAIEKLNLAITENPKFVNALNELGVQYMALGDLAKAEGYLRTAVAADAGAFDPLTNLGIVLFRLKRFDEAEPALNSSLKMNSQSAIAHYYLGRTFMGLDKPDDAIKELNATIAVGGDEFKEAHRLLSLLYLDKGDRQHVVDELETYLKLVPNAKDADELRVVIQQNKGPKNPNEKPNI